MTVNTLKYIKLLFKQQIYSYKCFDLPVVADAGSWSKVKHAIPSQNRFNILNCHTEYEIIWHTCTIADWTSFHLYIISVIFFSVKIVFVL